MSGVIHGLVASCKPAAGGGPEWLDNFTDTAGTALTAHTSDSGATYTASGAGTAVLAIETGGTSLKSTTAMNTRRLFKASVTPATKDQTITAVFTINNTGKNTIHICARVTDVDNYYGVDYDNGIWEIYQIVGGTQTQLGTWTDAGGTGNRTAVFSVTDAAKTLTVDGTQRINYTATNAITAKGSYGMVTWYTETGAGYSTMDSIQGAS